MRPAPDPPGLEDAPEPAPAPSRWNRTRRNVAIVLWPSFLTAAAATMFFFAVFDPTLIGEGTPLQSILSNRNAGYAFGFFVFWLLAAAASALTLYLARTERPDPLSDDTVEPWMREIP
jgi:hypothetical protein